MKTNIHPEAQSTFTGPRRVDPVSGEVVVPEQNLYVQYSHLDQSNVSVGDNVDMGQVIGTSGQAGNAQNQDAAEAHLHTQVGTSLIAPGSSITGGAAVNPSLVYDGVSFESADPTANQTNTSVIRTTINANGQQRRTYQQVGNQSSSGNSHLLDEVEVIGGG
ncbi:MAG: M23 family metallopeptidase [Bacteroidota bacterium]